MTNLAQRSLSSVAFVALIIGPLFLSGRIAYSLYAVLGMFTLNELLKLLGTGGANPAKMLSIGLFGLLVVVIYQSLFHHGDQLRIWVAAAGATALLISIYEIFRKNSKPLENVAIAIWAPIFVAASFLGLAYFFSWRDDLPQPWFTISVFALIWINDSAAYIFGRAFGKTKLIPSVSPGKTVEGSVAGLITALTAAIGLSFIDGMPSMLVMSGFGAVCILFGSLGDLFESRLKRAAGVKDSGKFLPGHGGFFDRFDAMMMAIPATILYFELFLPKP